MNCPKAKEIIDLNIKGAGAKMPPDVKKALTIGSEAIEEVMKARDGNPALDGELLPSETED